MVCRPATEHAEESAASVLCILVQIGDFVAVRIQIVTVGVFGAGMHMVAQADIRIQIPFAGIVVDVTAQAAAEVSAIIGVGACLDASVIAFALVLFQYYVDDSCCPLRAVLGRRVGDHLYSLDVLRRHLLQNLPLVVGGQAGRLAIDPDGHVGVAAQRDTALVVNLHRRDGFKQLAGRTARLGQILIHVEDLLVNLQSHLGTLGHHIDTFQLLRYGTHLQLSEADIRHGGCHREIFRQRIVAGESQQQAVTAGRQSGQAESAAHIRYGSLHQPVPRLLQHTDSHIFHRSGIATIGHHAAHTAHILGKTAQRKETAYRQQ